MTVLDPALCERLAAECREDDERMTPVPWSTVAGSRFRGAVGSAVVGGVAPAFDDVPDPGQRAADNADGCARTRNNLSAIAEQLTAAAEMAGKYADDLEVMRATEADLQHNRRRADAAESDLSLAYAAVARGSARERDLEAERDALREDVNAKQRGYDDLHAMVHGSGDIWTKVDKLLQRMAADKSRSMSIESRAILERDAARAEVERLRAGIREALRETPNLEGRAPC